LLLVGFPAPPPEPGGTVTEYRARHKTRRIASVAGRRDRAAVLVRLAVAIVLGAANLSEAVPDTMRFRLYHLPARLADHARRRWLGIERTWPWAKAFTTRGHRLTALPAVTDDLTTRPTRQGMECRICRASQSAA
jgi:hypothetical protein